MTAVLVEVPNPTGPRDASHEEEHKDKKMHELVLLMKFSNDQEIHDNENEIQLKLTNLTQSFAAFLTTTIPTNTAIDVARLMRIAARTNWLRASRFHPIPYPRSVSPFELMRWPVNSSS